MTETHSLNVGDYAVCPGHGVGQICDIETKEIGGSRISFFHVRIISNSMLVMVPVNTKAGIRPLVGGEDIQRVYRLLSDHDVEVDNSTWNRRYREYMNKIKTGSIYEIADVLRALFLLKTKKSLSFGEKKMLDQCKEMIVEEISLSGGHEKNRVNTEIDSLFH